MGKYFGAMVLCWAGSCMAADCIGFLPGDLNRDCAVDLQDFSLLAHQWLNCSSFTEGCRDHWGRVFYAAPDGSGSGADPQQPMAISGFWSVAQAGDTLILLNGLYQKPANLIQPPPNLYGTPDQPITVRCQQDGGATLDGEGNHIPVRLYRNSFFRLIGFNAKRSSDSVVVVERSNYTQIHRVCAWDARDGNCFTFWSKQSDFVVFEDCAGWGIARKIFVNTYYGDYCTFRRCWARWDGCHNIGPKMAFSTYYDSVGGRFENCVGTWSTERMQQTYMLLDDNQPDGLWRDTNGNTKTYTDYQVENPLAVFGVDNQWHISDATDTRVEGCIAYTYTPKAPLSLFQCKPAFEGDTYQISDCLAWQSFGGQQAYYLDNTTATNLDYRINLNTLKGTTTVTWADINPCDIMPWPLPIQDRILSLTGHDMAAYVPCKGNLYYAAPGGSGTGSYSDPMSIAAFCQRAQPGDTLILTDGLYAGSQDMIAPANNLDGTETDPIIVQAEHDGQAILDGNGLRVPLNLYGCDYWQIRGIQCKNSSGNVIALDKCGHLLLDRVTAYDGHGTHPVIFYLRDCTEVQVTDCAGAGVAEKIFEVNNTGSNIRFQRCFGKFTESTGTASKSVFDISYKANPVTLDGCVALIDPSVSGITNLNGAFTFSSPDPVSVHLVNCVARNRGLSTASSLFRLTGGTNPPACSVDLSNCRAYSEAGTPSGFMLNKCQATQIESNRPNSFTNCCQITLGTFSDTAIGDWPMRDRIINETGIDVESLY
jgi:hypothetical protein